MDKREQIRRIEEMEKRLNASLSAVHALDRALEEYQAALEDMQILADYLSSPDWRTDFEADEAGLLPPDLRRGALSEDGIPHLLDENDEVRSLLRELAGESRPPL